MSELAITDDPVMASIKLLGPPVAFLIPMQAVSEEFIAAEAFIDTGPYRNSIILDPS
jgi:hypothetical protein